MAKKGRPVKGAKGMKTLNKFGKVAKKALLKMSKGEREMVVAGLVSEWICPVCKSTPTLS